MPTPIRLRPGIAGGFKLLAALSAIVLTADSGSASKLVQSEQAVKAAFLVNFMKYIEWPQSSLGRAGEPVVIGIVGKDPFGKQIDDLVVGKSAHGRKIQVRRVTWSQSKEVHLLFVPESEALRYDSLPKSVVTVGETEGFAAKHGVIGFGMENRRIMFEINPTLAKEMGVNISSRLLQLARIVSKS